MEGNHASLLSSQGDLELEVVSSNVLAGTWVMSAVLSGFDHGKIGEIKLLSMKKGKSSFDLSMVISVGEFIYAVATHLMRSLKNEARKKDNRIGYDDLKSEIVKNREAILPIIRALKYMVADNKARISEMRVNDVRLTKETINHDLYKQLKLDDFEHDNRKYLK